MTHSDHAAARDRDLLAGVGKGDGRAFEAIYGRHKDRLMTVAFHMLGDRGAAEDVLQDVFVGLVGKARRIRLRGSLRSYLLTSVLNRCRDLARRTTRRGPTTEFESAALAAAARAPDGSASDGLLDGPLKRALDSERDATIARALGSLPPEQREVVVLHLFESLTFRAVAALLAIPSNTAQSRYRYAMAALRDRLTSEGIGK